MKTTKEKIEVMQAFEDGKTIQAYDAKSDTWIDIADPTWGWCLNDYRIKPENPDYKRGYDAALEDMYTILNGIHEKHRLKLKDPFTRNEQAIFIEMSSDYLNYIRELGHELGKTEEEV